MLSDQALQTFASLISVSVVVLQGLCFTSVVHVLPIGGSPSFECVRVKLKALLPLTNGYDNSLIFLLIANLLVSSCVFKYSTCFLFCANPVECVQPRTRAHELSTTIRSPIRNNKHL